MKDIPPPPHCMMKDIRPCAWKTSTLTALKTFPTPSLHERHPPPSSPHCMKDISHPLTTWKTSTLTALKTFPTPSLHERHSPPPHCTKNIPHPLTVRKTFPTPSLHERHSPPPHCTKDIPHPLTARKTFPTAWETLYYLHMNIRRTNHISYRYLTLHQNIKSE